MEAISKRQARLFAIILALDGMLFSLPNKIFIIAKMDAWVSYVVAMLGVLLVLWLISKVMARFPEKDLFEILTSRYPVLGRVAALPMLLVLFLMLIRDIRMLTEFVSIELLPNTPLAMICMLIVVSIVLPARGGLEIVARMTELWLPILILIIAAIPFLLFPEFETRHLMPFFDKGLYPPLEGGWFALAYMGQMLILPYMLSSSSFSFKDGFMSLAISTFLALWINTFILLSMGEDLAGKMLFPLYESVRLVRVTDFLDRFDLLLNLSLLPVVVTKVGLILFAVAHGIRRIVPAIHIKEMTGAFGAWCFVCSFWFFTNAAELFSFIRPWSVLAVFSECLLPFIFFVMLRPKRNGS